MKLLQQLFGGNGLSWFGRSRTKVNASSGAVEANKTTHVTGDACGPTSDRQMLVTADVVDDCDSVVSRSTDSDESDVTARLSHSCWSPAANRICWGSPSSRQRAVDLEQDGGGWMDDVKLPHSRSLIRTNPWLPPSSPPLDRCQFASLRRSPSPLSGSGSMSCPSTPADSPVEPGRRWHLTADDSAEATTPVASEGYYSVSSLCTMSDSAAVSTTACSDEMQMSVDSLASLFPTLMSSSSTSFHDGGGASAAFVDSVVDSGIVLSTTSLADVDSAASAVQQKEVFDVPSTRSTENDRLSSHGTATNKWRMTTSSPATLREHLSAVQTALDRGHTSDYKFDSDVFPFGAELRQRPTSTEHHQSRSDRGHTSLQSRGVEEISESLAASVERLRRGRLAVEGAFSRALAEDRRRQRELTRLRRRMIEAQRDVLLGTLRDLRRDLDDQCRRLQTAYDAVLAARWPRLHINTAYVNSASVRLLPTTCQSPA